MAASTLGRWLLDASPSRKIVRAALYQPRRRGKTIVLAAALGFFIGAFARPTPLVSLESAQVVAGVVRLPPDNPMAIDHTSVYSLILVQLPALLLKAGISETTLSIAGSGLQAGLAFAAVAAATLAFSQSPLLALALPVVLTRLPEFAGHKYPVLFPNDPYDAGVVGMFSLLLALSLLSLSYRRLGPFLLGVVPAAHVTLGVAAWIASAGALLALQPFHGRRLQRSSAVYFVAGAGVFVTTFFAHRLLIAQDGDAGGDERARELADTFMMTWDVHRQSAGFREHPERLLPFFEVDVYVAVFALAAFSFVRERVAPAGRFLLAAALVIAIVATSYTLIDELAPGDVPPEIRSLMITRWLNFDSILLPIAVCGSLGYLAFRRRQAAALAALAVLIGLIASRVAERETILRSDWQGLATGDLGATAGGVVFPAGTAITLALLASRSLDRVARLLYVPGRAALVAVLSLIILVKVFAGVLPDAYANARNLRPGYMESTSSDKALLVSLRGGDGVLIVPPPYFVTYHWPQLQTRRGLVLDTDILDLLTYAPEAAPATERALNRIYGTSIGDPRGWRSFGHVRALWEARPRDEWASIGAEFAATVVLVPREWRLELRALGRSTNLTAYEIPIEPRLHASRGRSGEADARLGYGRDAGLVLRPL